MRLLKNSNFLSCKATDTSIPNSLFSEAIANLDGVESDTDLAALLLETAEVALVPGSAFGAPGCMRLSFAVGMDTLKEAMRRIEQALAK